MSNRKIPFPENFDKVIKNKDGRYFIRDCCNYDMIKRPKAGELYQLCREFIKYENYFFSQIQILRKEFENLNTK